MNFVAIDFETATGNRNSACAVGIVIVENGIITEEFSSLIQPPDNEYWWNNIQIHGITPAHTIQSPTFDEIFPELKRRIIGKTIVAHNESFDRSVLTRSMEYYQFGYSELELPNRWECTLKIYRTKGFAPAKLDYCCRALNIELNHHDALSDARACAKLFLLASKERL